MENIDFKISIQAVWGLIVGSFFLTLTSAFAKIQHWESAQFLLILGLLFFFSTWIIVISDMAKNKIYNRIFWIISMFILPAVAPIIYLLRRNHLLQ